MKTMEVIEEDSFEYEGPIAQCKGGGGASGAVDFPDYMKTAHSDWLDDSGADSIESSMVDIMNAALGDSPFAAAAAYDPDTDLTAMETHVTNLSTLVSSISSGIGTLVADVIDGTKITDAADAFDSDLSDQLDANVYPRFEAGMRDINMVMSSYFVIGRAVIEDARVRESAKFLANLHLKAATDDSLKLIAMILQFQQSLSHMGIETRRLRIVAKSEESDKNLKYDEADAKWDLEVFQYGGNLLASISGAAHYVPNKEDNRAQSAIGGALSGAATGAMIGSAVPGIGTVAGAIAGGVLGLGQAFL